MKVLYAFGLNADGQCGAQKPEDSNCVLVPKPVHFPSKISVLVVSAGSRHTLAISENGDMYSWGWGHLGQLGHGDTISVHSPKLVQALAGKGIISIAAGGKNKKYVSLLMIVLILLCCLLILFINRYA